jgi:proteasome lid subunit RPN8/RPN11
MLGKRRKVWAIDRHVLEMVNASARESLPNEFVAAMRAEDGVISELLFLPGTMQGTDNATIMLHMLPIDYSVVGTVHSHPGPSNHWSQADLELFQRFGHTHIITRLPFDMHSWQAYDMQGNRIVLEVVELD